MIEPKNGLRSAQMLNTPHKHTSQTPKVPGRGRQGLFSALQTAVQYTESVLQIPYQILIIEPGLLLLRVASDITVAGAVVGLVILDALKPEE